VDYPLENPSVNIIAASKMVFSSLGNKVFEDGLVIDKAQDILC